jgi:hypothetical protein
MRLSVAGTVPPTVVLGHGVSLADALVPKAFVAVQVTVWLELALTVAVHVAGSTGSAAPSTVHDGVPSMPLITSPAWTVIVWPSCVTLMLGGSLSDGGGWFAPHVVGLSVSV